MTTEEDKYIRRKPSEICKLVDLDSLKHLSELSGESEQTLINWHKTKVERFYNILIASLVRNAQEVINSNNNNIIKSSKGA